MRFAGGGLATERRPVAHFAAGATAAVAFTLTAGPIGLNGVLLVGMMT